MNHYQISFKNFRLDVKNLNLNENIFIYGKNGAGKSTLLKMIAGLFDAKSKNDILYFHDQDLGLFGHATGLENLKLFNVDLTTSIFEKWVNNCVVFKTALSSTYQEMSLGMKKIIKLFLFFNTQAKILCLDEVFSGFDKETEEFLILEILSQNKISIMSGHRFHEKFKSIELEEGRVVN